eukprot:CAMPEP_0175860442 /NCGR_PEP_ID=MMETSP0107_2-20121207/30816_1 /TAXON_ID=195067 ORGANISM="Goniomonas pacifica, Strain CCMP1869" /NCGR_SAMPLE_ID=MMETSP0107_2 /ASSEMBLY_ACC=CAM_ASM_000203 /LENGTH=141 /DNA_ID=CAMNT_0017177179 /DNA_START=79 /DNA_END=502 /DNA_ORIENTATION=-
MDAMLTNVTISGVIPIACPLPEALHINDNDDDTSTTHQHINAVDSSDPPLVQLLVKEEPAEQGQQQLSAAPSGDSNLGPDIKALIVVLKDFVKDFVECVIFCTLHSEAADTPSHSLVSCGEKTEEEEEEKEEKETRRLRRR